jgi:hypothetical protein
MREDFEAALGQGGLGGADTSGRGVAAIRRFREQIQKEARDLAFMEREGLVGQTGSTAIREDIRARALLEAQRLRQEFAQFPAVLDAIDKAVQSVEFGNFGAEIATARAEIDRLVPTLDSLKAGLGDFAGRLANMPAAADPASVAVRQLSRDYLDLANAIYTAIAAQDALTGSQ